MMLNLFIITMIIILLFIYCENKIDFFQSECWTFNDDYNACYSNPNCTIGFLSDGSTHCMKKFLYENI